MPFTRNQIWIATGGFVSKARKPRRQLAQYCVHCGGQGVPANFLILLFDCFVLVVTAPEPYSPPGTFDSLSGCSPFYCNRSPRSRWFMGLTTRLTPRMIGSRVSGSPTPTVC